MLLLAGSAGAYTVSSEVFVSAGGTCSNSAYSVYASMGDGLASFESSPAAPTQESNPPAISGIKFDGQTIIASDYVSASPVITAAITDDASGIDTARTVVELDSMQVAFNGLPAGSSFTGGLLVYKPVLTSGNHTFRILAFDLCGNAATSESFSFRVDSSALKVDKVLNYPNPFNPASGQTTEINYSLNANADITIYIYNLIGQPVKRLYCPSGSEGGHAGYNRVIWTGETDFGEIAANDVYIARVVSGGQQLGKCKIAVLK